MHIGIHTYKRDNCMHSIDKPMHRTSSQYRTLMRPAGEHLSYRLTNA